MYNYENEFNQSEFEVDELNPELEDEYDPVIDSFYEFEEEDEFENEFEEESEYEFEDELTEQESTFDEATQMELASELLSVTNDNELDMFIGGLISKAVGGLGSLFKSPKKRKKRGSGLGKTLKSIAKKALPIATSFIPGVGPLISGPLGAAASNIFELELEGLSPEDSEFEIAKAFVRFAGNAAKNAVSDPEIDSEDEFTRRKASNRAIVTAARTYAPSLLKSKNRYYPRRGYSAIGRRYYSPKRQYSPVRGRYYSPIRNRYNYPESKYYYPGKGYYDIGHSPFARSTYYGGAVTNTDADTGGRENFLMEKIRKLEETIQNLTAQLQTPPPPPPSEFSNVPGSTPPPEKEYYEYY